MKNATNLQTQLSCNKHTWHGKPAALPCRKCAWELEKNAKLDNRFSDFYVVNRPNGGTRSAPVSSSRPPVVATKHRGRGSELEASQAGAAVEPAKAVNPSPLWKRCAGCADSARNIVWGLELRDFCAQRVNDVALTGVCVGVGYWIAASAFVQWLREIPAHMRPRPQTARAA